MILTPLWMYMIFNEDKIMAKTEQLTKEAEKAGMTLEEYLESISPLNDKKKLSWSGKNCKDCGNEKCKKLGTLPKGYDCALWQSEIERCETCKYYRRLKHNFKHGKGFDESYACVIYVNDRDAFVLEVNANDICEMYSKANHE